MNGWLMSMTRIVGKNYLNSDVNYDGITDFKDFSIAAQNYEPNSL